MSVVAANLKKTEEKKKNKDHNSPKQEGEEQAAFRPSSFIALRYSFFVFQAEDGIRDFGVTGVQTCALPISTTRRRSARRRACRSAPTSRTASATSPRPAP